MTPDPAGCIATFIAGEIGARADQVAAAVNLLDGGATVPFVARCRKEATGGPDDRQLRTLSGRLVCLRDMDQRRMAILGSIRDPRKLTAELETALACAVTKAELEDISLPSKVKRRTRAMIARENGLAPLADAILADRMAVPAALSAAFLTGAVPDTKAVLDGARDILAETLPEDAALLGRLHTHMQKAIRVFARNLKDLLLAAPAGGKTTMGLDPGIRSGVKVAVVDGTGRLLDTATVCPFQPKNDLHGAQAALAGLIRKHGVTLISIGNGTASRETEKRVADLLALLPGPAPKPFPIR
jgi:transcriptional accessory protein Tex/SPT6